MDDRNYEIPENPVYDPEIRALKTTDPAHADTVFNPLFQKIITNVHALKLQAEDHTHTASQVKLDDGMNIQEKFDNGTLGGGTIVQAEAPPGNATKTWIRSTDGVAHFWDGNGWVPQKAAFG